MFTMQAVTMIYNNFIFQGSGGDVNGFRSN